MEKSATASFLVRDCVKLFLDGRRAHRAELDAGEEGRVAARKHGLEAVAVRETIESGRGRDDRGGQPAPERGQTIRLLQHQVRDAKQRLAQKAPADAGRDLIVSRRQGRLAGDLPEHAAGKRVSERLPVVEAGRSREAVIHGALVRVQELVRGERIVVEHPGTVQIAPDGRGVDVIGAAVDKRARRSGSEGSRRRRCRRWERNGSCGNVIR